LAFSSLTLDSPILLLQGYETGLATPQVVYK